MPGTHLILPAVKQLAVLQIDRMQKNMQRKTKWKKKEPVRCAAVSCRNTNKRKSTTNGSAITAPRTT